MPPVRVERTGVSVLEGFNDTPEDVKVAKFFTVKTWRENCECHSPWKLRFYGRLHERLLVLKIVTEALVVLCPSLSPPRVRAEVTQLYRLQFTSFRALKLQPMDREGTPSS